MCGYLCGCYCDCRQFHHLDMLLPGTVPVIMPVPMTVPVSVHVPVSMSVPVSISVSVSIPLSLTKKSDMICDYDL